MASRPETVQTKYKFLRKLGDTLFGDVWLCEHAPTRRLVVIKRSNTQLAKTKTSKLGAPCSEDLKEELRLHAFASTKRCPHLVSLLDIDHDGEHIYAVTELCNFGEMVGVLNKWPPAQFGARYSRHFFRQLMTGVAFLHSINICHMDISLENLFLDLPLTLKLGDFGNAVERAAGQPVEVSSSYLPSKANYRAPEIYTSRLVDPRLCDIWSCGVVLFAFLAYRLPFDAPDLSPLSHPAFLAACEGKFRDYCVREPSDIYRNIPPLALDLLSHMLCPVTLRYSTAQVLAHPFLALSSSNSNVNVSVSPSTPVAVSPSSPPPPSSLSPVPQPQPPAAAAAAAALQSISMSMSFQRHAAVSPTPTPVPPSAFPAQTPYQAPHSLPLLSSLAISSGPAPPVAMGEGSRNPFAWTPPPSSQPQTPQIQLQPQPQPQRPMPVPAIPLTPISTPARVLAVRYGPGPPISISPPVLADGSLAHLPHTMMMMPASVPVAVPIPAAVAVPVNPAASSQFQPRSASSSSSVSASSRPPPYQPPAAAAATVRMDSHSQRTRVTRTAREIAPRRTVPQSQPQPQPFPSSVPISVAHAGSSWMRADGFSLPSSGIGSGSVGVGCLPPLPIPSAGEQDVDDDDFGMGLPPLPMPDDDAAAVFSSYSIGALPRTESPPPFAGADGVMMFRTERSMDLGD